MPSGARACALHPTPRTPSHKRMTNLTTAHATLPPSHSTQTHTPLASDEADLPHASDDSISTQPDSTCTPRYSTSIPCD
eukprot:1743793-Rhodomonas_salina.1